MTGKRKKTIVIISWILCACLLVSSVSLIVMYKTGVLFSGLVKLSVKGVVTQNVEDLYSAILYNDSFTFTERINMLKYNQYFVDNKYIECDRVCEKLATLTIENDSTLIEEGISGTYTVEGNILSFATARDRRNSLAHELNHSMQSEELSYEEYGWFIEGYTGLVTYEYFDEMDVGGYMLPFFVRGLCEIVGSEVIFQTDAKGDIDILKKALTDKGVSEATVEEAFNMFYELWTSESYGETVTNKQKVKAIRILVEMYDVANDYPEDIPETLYITSELVLGESTETVYYLNSAKRSFGSITGSSSSISSISSGSNPVGENSTEYEWLYREDLLNYCDDIESGAIDEFMNS